MSKLKERQFSSKGELIPFFKRLFTYGLKYKKWFSGFIIFVLGVAAVEAVFPLIWLSLLDNVIVPSIESNKVQIQNGLQGNSDLSGLTYYVTIIFSLGAALSGSVFLFIHFGGKIQEYIMFDIRQDLFKKLQELTFSFYDKAAVGWLMSRITSDTIKVTELISWGLIEFIWGIGMIVFCITAMLFYDVRLAMIVILTIPFLILISFKIRKLILKYSRESRKFNSEITASYNEHIVGVEVNKSMVQENRVSDEFDSLSDKMRVSSYKSAYFSALYQPLVIFGGSMAAALIIYYGGSMAITFPPEISVGMLAAFFGYATLIYEPILDISRFYSQAQNCISAGERIFSLLDTKPAINDKEDATDFIEIEGEITFENVSFYYEKNKPVLENMDLRIEKGQSIALVGETGGGKSSIINLICRFYEPTAGRILIDGEDYTDKTTTSLRNKLGVVLQTPHLFSGTIRENIKYGRDDADENEIVNSLLLIGGDEFIERLDEEVGEGGEKLSLGEKQMISFARAILADPRIFIMDEATSSIDTLAEAKIQKGIHELIKGRTSIIIAHRLSTIKNCDRIIVIKKGKIIEDGSHKVLMLAKGNYYNLYTRQLREQRENEMLTKI
ncbi:MAG TPA: ABC transporter ATP-binding protein [Ignavibacteria bacterium]|nr:ABC transporter ATP-binding protein [Ignavibacteria bacterium]HRB00136.1 ABC transporter ATP-binding protein [Ignavibacteria bacterium]